MATSSSSLFTAIAKLALAGEQTGLTVEQMIQLLNAGITVQDLLELIAQRLDKTPIPATPPVSSRWIM
jgi:hypothetical protein